MVAVYVGFTYVFEYHLSLIVDLCQCRMWVTRFNYCGSRDVKQLLLMGTPKTPPTSSNFGMDTEVTCSSLNQKIKKIWKWLKMCIWCIYIYIYLYNFLLYHVSDWISSARTLDRLAGAMPRTSVPPSCKASRTIAEAMASLFCTSAKMGKSVLCSAVKDRVREGLMGNLKRKVGQFKILLQSSSTLVYLVSTR